MIWGLLQSSVLGSIPNSWGLNLTPVSIIQKPPGSQLTWILARSGLSAMDVLVIALVLSGTEVLVGTAFLRGNMFLQVGAPDLSGTVVTVVGAPDCSDSLVPVMGTVVPDLHQSLRWTPIPPQHRKMLLNLFTLSSPTAHTTLLYFLLILPSPTAQNVECWHLSSQVSMVTG